MRHKYEKTIEYFILPFANISIGITLKGRDCKDNLAACNYLKDALNTAERIILMEQVHGSVIRDIHSGDHLLKDNCSVGGVDGIFLADKGKNTLVGVKIADCIPVFAVSNRTLIGAFHAGWRGLAEKIGEKFVERAVLYGYGRDDIFFYAGPHICKKCLVVGDEVKRKFPAAAVNGDCLNMFMALEIQLTDSGVDPDKIKLLKTENYCTYENLSYYSHRQGDPQRMIAFAIQQD